MQLGFGDLVQFFDAQHHVYVVDMVKVTLEFGKFVVHIITQSFGNLDMVSGQVNLHNVFLLFA